MDDIQELDKGGTMIPRDRLWAADRLNVFADAPGHGPQHFRKKHRRDESPSPQFASAARSAELCAAHLRAKHLGKHGAAQITKSGNAGERPVLRERGYARHAIPCVGLRCLAEGPGYPARATTGAHMKGTDNA
jgi:hypothetical protein